MDTYPEVPLIHAVGTTHNKIWITGTLYADSGGGGLLISL